MKKVVIFIISLLMTLNCLSQPTHYYKNDHKRFHYNSYQNNSNDSKSEIKNVNNFIPLIVFFLGLLLLPISDRIKRNRQLKMLELYFNELITLLNQQVSKQLQEIQKCIDDIRNLDQNSFTLTRISGCSIANIEKINNV